MKPLWDDKAGPLDPRENVIAFLKHFDESADALPWWVGRVKKRGYFCIACDAELTYTLSGSVLDRGTNVPHACLNAAVFEALHGA